ncbi:hypothetical protein [Neoroseomonas lacus]|uniref:Uncharacterized protein n=1 Tax=Neoroseomonas lacus TaxID=287609 RepID=A0A917NJM3_9PROT|nr:hypothetical protein [Neoroseomonas lacus]GGJ06217.1 hypothetical protein GCM10011320_11240 [Neoroseomonas lacus]
MEARTTSEVMEFHHPFLVSSRSGPLPAGQYRVETEEEMIESLSFPAWRRISLTIARHGLASGRLVQALAITPAELAAALADNGRPQS